MLLDAPFYTIAFVLPRLFALKYQLLSIPLICICPYGLLVYIIVIEMRTLFLGVRLQFFSGVDCLDTFEGALMLVLRHC